MKEGERERGSKRERQSERQKTICWRRRENTKSEKERKKERDLRGRALERESLSLKASTKGEKVSDLKDISR